jgi:predicted RNA-binding Zn-ribbon protein involved in translation (DUF1610 family)
MDEAEKVALKLKPPRCPKCGKEIDYLIYTAKELVKADAYLSDRSIVEYHNWDTINVDYDTIDYECPECGEVLFHDERDVERFLKGEI